MEQKLWKNFQKKILKNYEVSWLRNHKTISYKIKRLSTLILFEIEQKGDFHYCDWPTVCGKSLRLVNVQNEKFKKIIFLILLNWI